MQSKQNRGWAVEIRDGKATEGLSESYRKISELSPECNIAELEAFGFTVIEIAASAPLVKHLKALCSGLSY